MDLTQYTNDIHCVIAPDVLELMVREQVLAGNRYDPQVYMDYKYASEESGGFDWARANLHSYLFYEDHIAKRGDHIDLLVGDYVKVVGDIVYTSDRSATYPLHRFVVPKTRSICDVTASFSNKYTPDCFKHITDGEHIHRYRELIPPEEWVGIPVYIPFLGAGIYTLTLDNDHLVVDGVGLKLTNKGRLLPSQGYLIYPADKYTQKAFAEVGITLEHT